MKKTIIKEETLYNWLVLFVVLASVVLYFLWGLNESNMRDEIGRCVSAESQAQHFPGNREQAWNTFYAGCAK